MIFEDNHLKLVENDNQLLVTVQPSDYDRKSQEFIKEYVKAQVSLTENGELVLAYELPAFSESLATCIAKATTDLERYSLAQKVATLTVKPNDFNVVYLHPQNIYVSGNDVRLIHYGVSHILAPQVFNQERYLKVYKALVASILLPKVDFELAVEGLDAVRESIAEKINAFHSIAEINQFISEKCHRLEQKNKESKVQVNKKQWRALVVGAIVLAVATLTLGFFTYKSYSRDLPLKNAVIDAQAAFMSTDYDKAIDILEPYGINRLPKSAKYVLATSFVKLDNLNSEQMEAVLNTITQSSDETILNYWIYLGRGDLEKALDVAQNIGDTQLILHAYTNLYEKVKADTKMSGSDKQKKLNEYEKEISKLSKELGETSGSQSNGD